MIPAPRRWVMVGCLQGRQRENYPVTVNKPLTMTGWERKIVPFRPIALESPAYLGIGTDDALSPLRSAIHTSLPKG